MKVAIVGGGSIGLLFSYYLNQKHEVVLYVRNFEQIKRLNEGLILHRKNKVYCTFVEVKPVSEWGKNDEDLSVVCVKQYHLSHLLDTAELSEEHPLLFVQNGMGHLKQLEQLRSKNLYVASVEHGALKTAQNEVSHTGEGVTKISLFRGSHSQIIKELFNGIENTFPYVWEQDYYRMLVKKLVVNSIINPLTAILRIPNGQLIDNPFYFAVLTQLFNEVKEILALDHAEDFFEYLVHVCRNTEKNRSSMLRDIEEQRPTEVDAILGFLIEQACEKQINAPQISMLYNMVKGCESKEKGK